MKQLRGRQASAATFIPLKNQQSNAWERQKQKNKRKTSSFFLKFPTSILLKSRQNRGNKQLAKHEGKPFSQLRFLFPPSATGELKKENEEKIPIKSYPEMPAKLYIDAQLEVVWSSPSSALKCSHARLAQRLFMWWANLGCSHPPLL